LYKIKRFVMKIIEIIHPSGLKQEAIKLFENEEFSNYVVFKNVDKPSHTIIEIDRRGGHEKEIEYDFLKTLTDEEIFKIFFPC
jgi:hypothetical protein